jgi:hypothetical protein
MVLMVVYKHSESLGSWTLSRILNLENLSETGFVSVFRGGGDTYSVGPLRKS